MRKCMFLTVLVALSVLNFGADAATRGNTRGTSATNNSNATAQSAAPVAARAGARQKVVNATSGNVAARAAAKQTVKATASTATAVKPNSARAASTQKVLQTGSKVATAATNTVVPQECQDAFYGCMDSFCMLDNVSGGRCSCSDRNAELNKVLDEILKLDEQSYAMATEGVERLKMGENADEVIARAKRAGDKVIDKESSVEKTNKARKLDLDAWKNSIYTDDDIFDEADFNVGAVSNALSKEGDALYKDAGRMCVAQMPKECSTYSSMLQSVYAQKIKSDCSAYENSLKQQKSASQQKLQAAETALREAALEKFQEENKYGLGQCQARYAQCMQTTAGCGSDYTGCVTLAAAENVQTAGNVSSEKNKKAKQTTIKGAVSSITLAASTIDQLMAKKNICDDEVLKYCVKVKDQVWDAFLADAAASLKSAELIAEDNLRQNCVKDVATCFQNACQGQFDPERESGKYDMCLADPSMVMDLCKIKLEPCVYATGGTPETLEDSSLWNGIISMLGAMRVDACTAEVKDCIQDICGEDYTQCIGLDTQTIGEMCSERKLTACQDRYNKSGDGTDSVRDFVAEVAQGIALQIDNSLADACQKAADAAMIKVCGATDSCEGADFDLSTLASLMKVEACKLDNDAETITKCLPDVTNFSDDEVYVKEYDIEWNSDKTAVQSVREVLKEGHDGLGVYAWLTGKPDISNISFKEDDKDSKITFVCGGNNGTCSVASGFDATNTKSVVDILDKAYERVVASIESDPKVQYCMTGRKVQGFNADGFGKDDGTGARFPKLTNFIRHTIASELLSKLTAKNMELNDSFVDKISAMTNSISERMADIAKRNGSNIEDLIDAHNSQICTCNANSTAKGDKTCYSAIDKNAMSKDDGGTNGKTYRVARAYIRQLTNLEGSYNAATNVCTVVKKQYNCTKYISPSCRTFDEGNVLSTSTIQMSKF